MAPARKSKPGPRSYVEKGKLPRRAGKDTRKQFRLNKMKSLSTMRAYRGGFNLPWRLPSSAKYMRRIGIKPPGQYKADNQHQGKMFALPSECTLTGNQAETILEKVYQDGATLDQVKLVRKTLSYAYELTTGISGENYPAVVTMYKSFPPNSFGEKLKSTMPERVPTPENLKKAYNTPWKKAKGWSLTKYVLGLLATWYTCVLGMRPNVDIDKIKKSKDHDTPWHCGYASTAMVGGRSKLIGLKKGTRPWRGWAICLCEGGIHRRIPEGLKLDEEGNPEGDEPGFDTCCPLAGMEMIFGMQEGNDKRLFPEMDGGKIKGRNTGDIQGLMLDWLELQEVDAQGRRFSKNCGRKALSEWLGALEVEYEEGLQIHGDLPSVWRTRYQKNLKPTNYDVRTQSTDPAVVTRALCRFAHYCGRGRKLQPEKPLSLSDRLNIAVLQALGQGDKVKELLATNFR